MLLAFKEIFLTTTSSWIGFLPKYCPLCRNRTDDPVCIQCSDRISIFQSPIEMPDRLPSQKVISLWDWPPGQSGQVIQQMIVHQKKNFQPSLVAWQATQMVSRLVLTSPVLSPSWNQRPVVFYPPRGRARDFNLAEKLATNVAVHLGASVAREALVRDPRRLRSEGSDLAQKQKTARRREQIRYSLRDDHKVRQTIQSASASIFVDDVYATGSTARAAYHALGAPSPFYVLCLACRLSAGER